MESHAQAAPLDQLLSSAEDQLWSDFDRARVFDHSGVIGSAREGAVARFLREHLPERFVVTTGQAVDASGLLTPQLDLILYDSHLSAPLLRHPTGPELVPAEALIAVVEVKSKFTREEATRCVRAATSLSQLDVYGENFVASRVGGADAADGAPRCMYSILAFESDLSAADWAASEWKRLREVTSETNADVSRIDRLTVLSRGLLVPPTCTALPAQDGKGILRDWFLHLTDFLVREAARRLPYDWDRYSRRPRSTGWEQLEGYVSVNQAKRDRTQTTDAVASQASKGNRPS